MNVRMVRLQILLVLGTLLVFALAGALAEFGYRLLLRRHLQTYDLTYRVAPLMYVEYDERFGERFKPSTTLWVTYVKDGRVVWGAVASKSNRDGLGGHTTLAQYDSSGVKILVFGDSFSHWNRMGDSWPDILQNELARRLGKRVAVLNYARGAFGVEQMLSLAADRAEALKPDLVILAPIGDDFTRARWWVKEMRKDGSTRWMMSSRKDAFLDYRYATDELLVDPRATAGWCDSTWREGGYDPVVGEINKRYVDLAREIDAVRKRVPLFTLKESFLLRRLIDHDPFGSRLRTLPRISYSDFRDDPETAAAIDRLRATGVPVMLVYLPIRQEMAAGRNLMSPQSRRLAASLEREFGTRFEELETGFTGKVPEQFDLKPFDGHPSRGGLEFYARNVAERCARRFSPGSAVTASDKAASFK